MAQFTPDRRTLQHLAAGRSWREIGGNVARRLGAPDRARALGTKYARFDRGDTASLYTEDDELHALAAEVGSEPEDLSGAVLWTFRDDEGSFVPLGLAVPFFSTAEAAYEARGLLSGVNGSPLVVADVVPTFLSERERWLAAHMPDLDAAEREYVLAVDPDERHLRTVWMVHRLATLRHSAARYEAVKAMRQFAAAGTLDAADLDALADLARRRLSVVDVPASLHAMWKREARNLAQAQRLALDVDLARHRERIS